MSVPGTERGLKESDIMAAAGKILEDYMAYTAGENQEDLRKALGLIRELEINAVRCLAETYGKLGMEDEALEAYERLVQIEREPERLEAAGRRKRELEELKTGKEENTP